MSSPDAEITNAKTGDDNNQPTSPTEVKLNDFDNLPQPDTWLYRNDSLSKAKREVSRRSLADLMNPNAEPTEEVLLAKKKAEDIVKSGEYWLPKILEMKRPNGNYTIMNVKAYKPDVDLDDAVFSESFLIAGQ